MKKYLVFCKYNCRDGLRTEEFCVLANDCYEALDIARAKPKKYLSADISYNLMPLNNKEASS